MAHHALIFECLAYCIRDVLNLVYLRLAAEHLVKGDLAGDGRGSFRLNISQILLDFFESSAYMTCMDVIISFLNTADD